MVIIQPKKIQNKKTNPILVIGLFFIVALTGVNAIVYTKTVAVEHDTQTAQKSLNETRTENAALKNSWYEAVNGTNMERLVKEYGFVKINSPHYLPS
ncbi:MAG: hypothetical protein EXS60_00555 [Candidatus Pacebacteria bacterium]|nr:hypothetical protein [Candidatus Paceibacterota bacterium]